MVEGDRDGEDQERDVLLTTRATAMALAPLDPT